MAQPFQPNAVYFPWRWGLWSSNRRQQPTPMQLPNRAAKQASRRDARRLARGGRPRCWRHPTPGLQKKDSHPEGMRALSVPALSPMRVLASLREAHLTPSQAEISTPVRRGVIAQDAIALLPLAQVLLRPCAVDAVPDGMTFIEQRAVPVAFRHTWNEWYATWEPTSAWVHVKGTASAVPKEPCRKNRRAQRLHAHVRAPGLSRPFFLDRLYLLFHV